MKVINIMGDDMRVIKSFDKAVCKHGTTGGLTAEPYNMVDIDYEQVVYDFNVLESSSVVFKLNPEDEHYYVTMFGSMFSQENGEPCDDSPITIDGDELRANRDKRKRELGLIGEDEFGEDKIYYWDKIQW